MIGIRNILCAANGEDVGCPVRNRATNGSDPRTRAVAPRWVAALPLCALAISLVLTRVDSCLARPPDQIVVLRHGGILQGQVRRERDRLVVTQSTDHVIRVSLDTVDFVVDNLDLAYQKKLERIEAADLQAHYRLAQWCLRHGLQDQAAERLLYLSRQSPNHPWVRVLESRLRQRANPPDAAATTPVIPASLPKRSKPVTMEQFPTETMAQFTRGVQPLLLNRCGQTTCHGSGTSSSLQLLRGPRGVQTQALTWQNLRSTLAQVNSDDPDASPLLQFALSLHGPAQRPPFEPYEQKQFQLLHDWVKAVTSGAEPASDPGESLRVRPVATTVISPDQRSLTESESEPESEPKAEADPFDPDRFNSQFAPPPAVE